MIYIPCDVVAVRVKLGFADTLTPIEKIVLKAVHAGVRTLGDLAAVLGLPQRMLVDIAQDLWKAKYLLVVRTKAGVRVSDQVARAITTNTLDKLKSAEVIDTTRKLMVDKLTNEIRPLVGRDTPGQRRFAVPVENRLTRLADLRTTDLLVALERDLANAAKRDAHAAGPDPTDRQGFHRDVRVLSAHLSGDELTAVGRQWLPVEVRPTVDPLDDTLTVTVVDSGYSDAQRAAANEQLSRLISARPNDDFVRALKGQAPPGLVEAPSLADGVERLRGQAVAAATIPAGQRRNWHLTLADHARRLEAQLAELTSREVNAAAVVGGDHTEALLTAITSARTQLVITAPWISYPALAAVAPAMRAALEGGVDIYLLWGISHDQMVDGRVKGLLYDMTLRNTKGRFAGKLHVPGSDNQSQDDPISGSSRTHAKVVIVDNERALVTSWNMLNNTNPAQEAGVVLTGIEQGPCHPVRELLKWARSIVPAYQTSNQMLVTDEDFALRKGTPRRERDARQPDRQSPAAVARHPEPRRPDDSEGEAAENAAKTWSKAWVEHANRVGARLASRTNADALIVVDGTHRELLKRAVRQACFRLAITSDQLSNQVVDDRFVAELRKALERGVEVAIRYKRPHKNDSPISFSATGPVAAPPTRAESALVALQAAFPGRFTVERVEQHAKVLVSDDVVVIGSFNFLSFEGFYNSGAAYRRQSEVSAQVTSPSFADGIAREMGLMGPRPASAVTALPTSDGIYLTVQRILNDVAADIEPAVALAGHLTTAAEPWTVLDHLAEDADRDLLRVAASTCLLHDRSATGSPATQRWARWLVEDLWSDGRYVEALLLRHLTGEAGMSPRLPIAVLAAARGTSAYPAALGNALSLLDMPLDTPQRRAAETAALLASAVEQTVFTGGKDAQDTLDLLLSELESAETDEDDGIEPWKVLGESALQYASESFGIALPVEVIKADLARRVDSDDRDRAWGRLLTALNRAEHTHFESTPSLRTHLYLFTNPQGLFTRLKDVVAGKSSVALAQWIAEPKLRNLGALIKAATTVASPGDALMHGTYLKRYVKLLESVIAEAKAVVTERNDDDVAGTDAGTERLLAAARPLAEVVAQRRPGLLAFIEQSTEAEARFLTSVVESFDELAVWAGGEESRG